MRTPSTLLALLCPLCILAQDGALDPGFGTGGKAYVKPPGLNQNFSKTVVQADGKIIIAGRSSNGIGYTFSIARFRADGKPDSTFDDDGVVTTIMEAGSRNDKVNTVAVQSDGKIIAGGKSNNNFALVRYNLDGSLDAGFNGTGIVKTPLPGFSEIFSVLVLSNGKILAGGNSTPLATSSDFTLVRYNANGTLDASFDGDGIVTTTIINTSADILYALAIQPDGKIAAAGSSGDNMALVRYNADGTLDNSFNGNGKLVIDFGLNEIAYSLAIQADGKLVVAGVSNSDLIFHTAVARVLAGGQLDNSFDGDGKVSTVAGETDQFFSVIIQPDAKIVASGITSSNGTSDYVVVRYNPDGSPDPGFDGDGKLIIDMGGAEAYATVAARSNTLVVGGYSDNQNGSQLAVVRLLNPSAGTILPVRLVSFTATSAGQTVKLSWKTTGTGLRHFEIEQSRDGRNFTPVGLLAVVDNNGAGQLYQHTVIQTAAPVYYYRLKMTDKKGSVTYSTILAVQPDARKDLFLSQNPVHNELRLQVNADEKMVLSVIDARGAVILKRQGFAAGSNSLTIDVSGMAKGVYYIVVTRASGMQRKAFVKD